MKQLFFSHTWQPDKLGRDNHKSVKIFVKEMQKLGWTTWFDEDDMQGNIDASMASGIDACRCVIVCITEAYCKKINESAKDPRKRDNCLKEWNYAHNRNKLMIPVIMEPSMLNPNTWPGGVVPLHLGNTLYVNFSNNYYNNSGKISLQQLLQYNKNITTNILSLHMMLLNYNLKPRLIYNPSVLNIKSPILQKMASRSKKNILRRHSKSCSSLIGVCI